MGAVEGLRGACWAFDNVPNSSEWLICEKTIIYRVLNTQVCRTKLKDPELPLVPKSSQNKGCNESKIKMDIYSLSFLTIKATKLEPLYSDNNTFFLSENSDEVQPKVISTPINPLSIVQ